MKKLMVAAMIAASMFAMADEAAKPAAATAEKPAAAAPAAKATARPASRRSQMTSEQREKMRAMREKFMAERKAKMEGQMLEVVKKYVPDEAKAKALVKELGETMMASRRNMMSHRGRKGVAPAAKPAAK